MSEMQKSTLLGTLSDLNSCTAGDGIVLKRGDQKGRADPFQ